MRVVGIDPGTKRVGVALSDPLGMIATPHAVFAASTAVEKICELCVDFEVETVVVGLPIGLSGNETESTRFARELAGSIEETCTVQVVLVDERFTSSIAERALLEAGTRREQRKEVRDKVAAAVILQSYLDQV